MSQAGGGCLLIWCSTKKIQIWSLDFTSLHYWYCMLPSKTYFNLHIKMNKDMEICFQLFKPILKCSEDHVNLNNICNIYVRVLYQLNKRRWKRQITTICMKTILPKPTSIHSHVHLFSSLPDLTRTLLLNKDSSHRT